MEHLKSFFRKSSTKLYLVIITVLVSGILILYSFINYYTEITNKIFSDNTILLTIGKSDYYEKLSDIRNISNTEEVLLISPDYNDKYIKNMVYTTENDKLDGGNDNSLKWDDLMIYSNFPQIMVIKDTENRLKKHEILLNVKKHIYDSKEDYIKKILNKEVGFHFEKQAINLTIKNIHVSKWPSIVVSEDYYKEMKSQSSTYTYKNEINDYRNSYKIKTEIENINNQNIEVIMESSFLDSSNSTLYSLDDLIGILKIVSYIVILIFIIIYVVVMNNIRNDIKKEAILNKKLGYKKRQIIQLSIVNFSALNCLVIIISTIFTIIINLLLRAFCNLNLLLDLPTIILVFLTMVIISSFLGFVMKLDK